MSNPPPVPQNRSIQRAVFENSRRFGSGAVTIDYNIIEGAQKKAEDWLNANPQLEIITIETFHSSISARTIVWYRT